MNRWDMLLKLAKVFLMGLLVVMLAGLIRGSAWNPDFSMLEAEVEANLDLAHMQQGDEQLLRRLYGLNSGELKAWVLYTAQDNMDVEELLLVEAAEAGQVTHICQAIEKRVETQKNNFEGYGPEQVQLIEKYVMRESDPFVLFVISENAEAVKAGFVKGLHE